MIIRHEAEPVVAYFRSTDVGRDDLRTQAKEILCSEQRTCAKCVELIARVVLFCVLTISRSLAVLDSLSVTYRAHIIKNTHNMDRFFFKFHWQHHDSGSIKIFNFEHCYWLLPLAVIV